MHAAILLFKPIPSRYSQILFDVYDRRGCERGSSSQTVVEIIVPTLLQLGQKALLVAGQK